MRSPCTEEGCGRPHKARGLCQHHYEQIRKREKAAAGHQVDRRLKYASDRERIERNVLVDESTGCWVWQGHVDSTQGYGRVEIRARKVPAHRLSYEVFVGPIPDGLQLDHLCCNRACVNPAHLDPVTQAENNRRARSRAARVYSCRVCRKPNARRDLDRCLDCTLAWYAGQAALARIEGPES